MDDKTLSDLLKIASHHLGLNQLHLAESIYWQILESRPNQPDALHGLGIIAGRVNKLSLADDYYEKAINELNKLTSGDGLGQIQVQWLNERAEVLLQLDRIETAKKLVQQSLNLRPDQPKLIKFLKKNNPLSSPEVHPPKKMAPVNSQISEIYLKAKTYFKQGSYQDAERNLRELLNKSSSHMKAYALLMECLRQQDKPNEAIKIAREALSELPNAYGLWVNLGVILKQTGQLDEAITCYKKALSIEPNLVQVHNNLGNALKDSNQLEKAVTHYQKAVLLKPDFIQAYCNMGIALNESGQTNEAINCFKKVLSIKPDYAQAYNNMAMIYLETDQADKAIPNFEKAISIHPQYEQAYFNIGNAYTKTKQIDKAIDSYQKALKLKPNSFRTYLNLGLSLKAVNQIDKAVLNFQKAISINPKGGGAYNNLGIIFQESGRINKAISYFRKAISTNPELVEAHRHLAGLKKHTEHDDEIKAMEKLYRRDDILDRQRMYLGFGLGKALGDLKQFEKAFEYILEANQIKRNSYEYLIDDDKCFFARIKDVFCKKFFTSLNPKTGFFNKCPVFIIGMPRSGTTLVEQTLASHPSVFACGESNDLSDITLDLVAKEDKGFFPECLPALESDKYKMAGQDYIYRIRKKSKDAILLTNKMPHNFLMVGWIKMILPDAKIIHCTRNPMDTCLSLFKNYFTGKGSHKYSYDLIELGQYYLLYQDLMKHWESLFPGYMYEIKYEQMISDNEALTNKLLNFCDLPWDSACLDFHKTRRSVTTSSVAQVRQPIYSDSVQLWKQYEAQLKPLYHIIYT